MSEADELVKLITDSIKEYCKLKNIDPPDIAKYPAQFNTFLLRETEYHKWFTPKYNMAWTYTPYNENWSLEVDDWQREKNENRL